MTARRLNTVDSYYFRAHGEYDGYLYGYRHANLFQRIEIGTDDIEQVSDLRAFLRDNGHPGASAVHALRGWFYEDFFLVQVRITTTSDSGDENRFWLLSSTDQGATWSKEMPLGDASGVHLDQTYILDRGLVRLSDGDVLFGEYSGVNGGKPLRVIRGTPGNWSTVTTFNEAGDYRDIRHIHTVKQDPYNGDIYIGTGDAESEAMLLRWDGTTPFPGPMGRRPQDLVREPGFGGFYGLQRYRVIDLQFTDDYVYSGTDNRGESEGGIWRHERGSNNPSSWQRVLDKTGHNWWGGWKTAEGIFWASQVTDDYERRLIYVAHIYGDLDATSVPGCEIVGHVATPDVQTSQWADFWWEGANGDLWMGSGQVAGSTFLRTWRMEVTNDAFRVGSEPDALMPKVWVDYDSGTDSTALDGLDYHGLSPRKPFKTLSYAMSAGASGARITYGHCVELMGGATTDRQVLDWSEGIESGVYGSGRPAEQGLTVQLKGESGGDTVLEHSGDGSFSGVISLEGSTGVTLRVTDLTLLPGDNVSAVTLHTGGSTGATVVLGSGAVLGDGERESTQLDIDGVTVIAESGSLINGSPGKNALRSRSGSDEVYFLPGSLVVAEGTVGVYVASGTLSMRGVTVDSAGRGVAFNYDNAEQAVVSIHDSMILTRNRHVGIDFGPDSEKALTDAELSGVFSTGSVRGAVGSFNTGGKLEADWGELAETGSVAPGEDSFAIRAGDPNRPAANDFLGQPYLGRPAAGAFEYPTAVTRYVSGESGDGYSEGSDANDGASKGSPYATLTHAEERTADGDTVWAYKVGDYDEETELRNRRGVLYPADGPDPEPGEVDPFSFAPRYGVDAATWVESEVITVSGLNPGHSAPSSITSGQYRIRRGGTGDWTSYTTGADTVETGDQVQVRVMSRSNPGAFIAANLTLGSRTGTFTVRTAEVDPDPGQVDPFSFPMVTNAAQSTWVTSNTVTVSGLDQGQSAAVSISGGEYRIGSGSWTSSSGTVFNGDQVQVRVMSSASPETTTSAVLTMGTRTGTFQVRTTSAEPIPEGFNLQELSALATSGAADGNTLWLYANTQEETLTEANFFGMVGSMMRTGDIILNGATGARLRVDSAGEGFVAVSTP